MKVLRTLGFVAALALVAVPVLNAAQAGKATPAAADSKAVKSMAGILASLNHFAGDAEKKTLKEIVDDKASSAGEKTVAQALLGVQHKVTDADKAKLEALVKDTATPASLKTIAEVVLKLNHTPSDTEKASLKKIAA